MNRDDVSRAALAAIVTRTGEPLEYWVIGTSRQEEGALSE